MIKEQRGAVIILFAAMIPFLMCFMGLVIDLGNMYAHYSKLQNAADAAAIAGGNAYAESSGDPGVANEIAQHYVDINDSKASFKSTPKIQEKDSKFYYVVVLKERVPLYFLRYFPQIGSDTEISAAACAQISLTRRAPGNNSNGGFDLFNNLFTANKFESVNAVQNPGTNTAPQYKNSCGTYDGKMVIGNQNSFNDISQKPFLTSEAFGEDGTKTPTVNEAKEANQLNIPQYDGTLNITKYYDENIKKMEEEAIENAKNKKEISTRKLTDQNLNSDTINELSISGVNVVYSDQNLTISINKEITGNDDNKDKPLYIICDYTSKILFSVGTDMTKGRPIVLIYKGGDFRFEGSSGIFSGNIYAPYGSVSINDNGLIFSGSIVANSIHLGSQGYFSQKNYTGSGSTVNTIGYEVTLVSAKDVL